MKHYDVTIIGAGLAGLFLSKTLCDNDVRVLLVDRKQDLSKSIHTTGIFVRKTFEDFQFPAGTLGPPISHISLYSPALRKIELESSFEEFRVGRMGALYNSFLQDCLEGGVDFRCATAYRGAAEYKNQGRGSIVTLERNGVKETVETSVLVGADGACSNVAKDLGLDQNRHWIVGYEEVATGVPATGSPEIHCFLNNRLAPGYLAWISSDGEETHIGVGGYPSRFDPRSALKVFKQEIVPQIIETGKLKIVEKRGGKIPVGGVLKRIGNRRGLLVGDAAGAVSPLTAGGLDPCLRLSKFAAEIITRRICEDDPDRLLDFSGSMFRKKFATRLMMRLALNTARGQVALEAGCALLGTVPGLRLAKKIFFERASFPDIDLIGDFSQKVVSKNIGDSSPLMENR
ncbi:MAG: NAD(P)/FAD-dependent oxidoreductase [Acidobacteriota bacterium]|nr:NAD(P)/FAD-dependent oxidoreductase [Acidobacteriota bacterium]MDH3530819.1 NAD(P)/FAD-dependent oxidoreductase [Acidobacteriota bacterium]